MDDSDKHAPDIPASHPVSMISEHTDSQHDVSNTTVITAEEPVEQVEEESGARVEAVAEAEAKRAAVSSEKEAIEIPDGDGKGEDGDTLETPKEIAKQPSETPAEATKSSSDDAPGIVPNTTSNAEAVARGASPAHAAPKKKFTSVNVNAKFLSKAASPAPASGSSVKPLNGRQIASPVPIPSSSRYLSTKLTTMPVVKTSASPNPPPPSSTSSSPWAKPSVPIASGIGATGELHQPAPTRLATTIASIGAGALDTANTSGVSTVTKMAWRTPSGATGMGRGAASGISRDFPTAKEVAEGQKRASLAAQAQAAHNQAILQELNTFTRIDSHSHRWDEDDEDDMIEFPDMPPSSHPDPEPAPRTSLPPLDDRPVSKAERFQEDFDRSWPRRTFAGDEREGGRVLFDAKVGRGGAAPSHAQGDRGGDRSERINWGSRLLTRDQVQGPPGRGERSGMSKGLPPHISDSGPNDPHSRGHPPHLSGPHESSTTSSGLPSRAAWGPRAAAAAVAANVPTATATVVEDGGWRERRGSDERGLPPTMSSQARRSFIGTRPNQIPAPASQTTPPDTSAVTSSVAVAPPGVPDNDPQSIEMHTAAEKARLRRLEEEKEREAAKERARMKAKMLEERFGGGPEKGGKPQSMAVSHPESHTIAQGHTLTPGHLSEPLQAKHYTLAQRPKDLSTTVQQAMRPRSTEQPASLRSETDVSWRARAAQVPQQHGREVAPEERGEQWRGLSGTSRKDASYPTPGSASPSAYTRPTEVSAETQKRVDSEQIQDQPPSAQPPLKVLAAANALDGMMAQIKAAMKQMQDAKDARVQTQEHTLHETEEELAHTRLEADVGREEEQIEERVKEKGQTVAPSTAEPKLPAQIQARPEQPTKPPSQSQSKSREASSDLPEFFDISYPAPPPSPPPAWRTYTVRIPKPSSSPSYSLPPVPPIQLKAWETPVSVPKGWALTFIPPLGMGQEDRTEWLLPRSSVVTEKGEIVVSISPRVLERVKERGHGVDGEVVTDSSGNATPGQKCSTSMLVAEASTQVPPRKKSPVKTAAQEEKEGNFLSQPVRLAIPPPAHIIPTLPASTSTPLPPSSATGGSAEMNGQAIGSAGSEIGKQGVRFMVSSELEGDKLLEEVNRVSLESVEEDGKVEEPKGPQTGKRSSPKTTTQPSIQWSKAIPFTHQTHSSQHDAIKSVWDSSERERQQTATSSSVQDAPPTMYPTLNAPRTNDLPSQAPSLASGKSGYTSHVSVPGSGASTGTGTGTAQQAVQFSPKFAGGAPFTRHPSTHSAHSHTPSHSHSQIPSPYFSPHSISSPDPSSGIGIMPGYNRPNAGAGGVSVAGMGNMMGSSAGVGMNGLQQGVWGGFGSPMAPGYGYTQSPAHSQHQHLQQAHPQQQASQQSGQAQKGYLSQQYAPNPYNRPVGYAYSPNTGSYNASPQVRPQGRFAQANGEYGQHQHQQPGAAFGISSRDGSSQGYYAGVVGGGVYSAQPQSQSQNQSQGAGRGQQAQGGQHGGYSRGGMGGAVGRGMGRKMW